MTERLLGERYRLERRLGTGGMATVYAGFDTVLRRRVAVKVLRSELASDHDFVARFYNEAQHAAKLSHPNVVSTYDVGRSEAETPGDEATYYIVMELVDGATLGELIEHDGRLPEPVAIDFAAQIASGLAYAHRQGLLHRDIKPANILLTKDDVVKISDFGIARAVSAQTIAMTQAGMVMGSVYYISPEQAQGHELDQTSDLYSLGVVLFQMLTGELPYTGDSPITVALKHVSTPVPSLDRADISPALAAIVRKLLQKDPANRFASATAVAAALRAAREQPATAPPDTDVPRGDGARPATATGPSPRPRPSRYPDKPDANKTEPIPVVTVAQAEVDPRRRDGGTRTGLLAVLALVALLIAGVSGYVFFGANGPFARHARPVELENYIGRPYGEAAQALANEGLQVRQVEVASESIPRDHVARQAPGPLANVAAGSIVELDVSTGLPYVDVTDLKNYSQADAERYLRSNKLAVRIVQKYDPAPGGTVLEQKPGPGRTQVRSTIALIVSQGPQPVDVPSVTSQTLDDAQRTLQDRGLHVDVAKVPSDGVAAGIVLTQRPDGGTAVARGTTVQLQVSSGPVPVSVPDIRRAGLDDALQKLKDAGFDPVVTYVQTSDGDGTVLDQTPAAGSSARRGAPVQIHVAVPGVVPDVSGQPVDKATKALSDAGYGIGNRDYAQEGAEGTIVRTDPPAGSDLRPGESVNITISGVGP